MKKRLQHELEREAEREENERVSALVICIIVRMMSLFVGALPSFAPTRGGEGGERVSECANADAARLSCSTDELDKSAVASPPRSSVATNAPLQASSLECRS